jgi:hypothetical protein
MPGYDASGWIKVLGKSIVFRKSRISLASKDD